MSVNCPITIQFQIRDEAGLFALAVRHRDRMLAVDRDGDEWDRDACRMLEYAAEAKGVALGPKGDMFTWGSVGNYSSADTFVDALRPFFQDLWRERVLFDFHTVVVMFQQEQHHTGHLFELSLDQTAPRDAMPVVVRDLDSTFPLFEGVYERSEKLLPRGIRTEIWESRK